MFKYTKSDSLVTKIMLGFVITITLVSLIIFVCCQYFNITTAKDNYKRLAESCARSTANALFNAPFEKYLTQGKDATYERQLQLIIAICQNFNLKYLYVYVPDFKNNVLTSVFYVDGKSNGNVKNRDLGTKVQWSITQQEKDAFNGVESNHMFIVNNQMGHTVTSYAVVRNYQGRPIALVGADLDFRLVMKNTITIFAKIILCTLICMLFIYILLIRYLQRVFIKPILEISEKMNHYIADKHGEFTPIEIHTKDELGSMAETFNQLVLDINTYMKKVSDTQMETIFSLAKLAQSRDDDTGTHLDRVRQYCYILAKELFYDSPYSSQMNTTFIENIMNASSLHDIGKVGISDLILLKKGKLTPEEFEIMKTHTTIGYDTLQDVHLKFGENSFIEMGMAIALYHHERWDGKGYPMGLSGEYIPLAARIMAIADVYDALSNKRVYKPPFSQEKCIEIIKEGSGTQFDPILVEIFLKVADKFYEVREEITD